MGWRHVGVAFAIHLMRNIFGPLGGIFLRFEPTGSSADLIALTLHGTWLLPNLLVVYCVMVADEAFNDGIPPVRAYGLALIAIMTFIPPLTYALDGLRQEMRQFGPPSMLFGALNWLFQGSLGLSIYGYWRVAQRSMRQAQAAETDRVRNEQRVRAARLLALQSRVEPEMLFDALGRIGALHVHEPQAADVLLADLIALLRAMLPGARSDNSTVRREFALVDAWLRVTSSTSHRAARVRLRMAAGVDAIGIAPMLVLPLLRAVLTSPDAAPFEWSLSAEAVGDRLIVELTATSDAAPQTGELLTSMNLSSLHDRLTDLFGRFAHLAVSLQPPRVTLDMPCLPEDPDDDRPDR
jgi:hypothetical protein